MNSSFKNEFSLREWQQAALKQYQRSMMTNFIIQACVASGKTICAELLAIDSLKRKEAAFIIVLVLNEHLNQSFADDAKNLGLNLARYNDSSVQIFRDGCCSGASYANLKDLAVAGYHGLIMPVQALLTEENQQQLRNQISYLEPNKVVLVIDEIHHFGDRLIKEEEHETPAWTKAAVKTFDDAVTARRILCTGTPFRSDPRKILGDWIEYEKNENGLYVMKVNKLGHQNTGICKPRFAHVNDYGVIVSYSPHALVNGWCPEVDFELPEYAHSWIDIKTVTDEDSGEEKDIEVPYNGITWGFCNSDAAKDNRNYYLSKCKANAVKPENSFAKEMLERINKEVLQARAAEIDARPESACLIIAPCYGDESGGENGDEYSSSILDRYCRMVKQVTGEDPWVIVGNPENCRAYGKKNPIGMVVDGKLIKKPSDLIKLFASARGVTAPKYVITQKMIAEGASIHRLDHLLFLGTDLTPMFLWQCLGRILRMFLSNKIAKFWSYPHPIIVAWAETIKDMIEAAKKKEGLPGEGPGPEKSTTQTLHRNNQFVENRVLSDGKTYAGVRLAQINHWRKVTKSALSISDAEAFIEEHGLWEMVERMYNNADEQPPETCYVTDVVPSRLKLWRKESLTVQLKIIQEIIRKSLQNRYWVEAFGAAAHDAIAKEEKTNVFKRASARYTRLLNRLKRESESTSKPYLELLYEQGSELVTSLDEINLDYLQFNYNFPAND